MASASARSRLGAAVGAIALAACGTRTDLEGIPGGAGASDDGAHPESKEGDGLSGGIPCTGSRGTAVQSTSSGRLDRCCWELGEPPHPSQANLRFTGHDISSLPMRRTASACPIGAQDAGWILSLDEPEADLVLTLCPSSCDAIAPLVDGGAIGGIVYEINSCQVP